MIRIIFCLLNALLVFCNFAQEQDLNLFQGDIVLTPEQRLMFELEDAGIPTFAASKTKRWPNPTSIPYVIDEELKKRKAATESIALAIAEIEKTTCIRLRPRTESDKGGIHFGRGNGCSSPVGYNIYRKENYISLAYGCWSKGVVVHEIMHSLGFWHEQSRPDRDKYVIIHSENIVSGGLSQFRKINSIDSMGRPYDYDSVLHYGTYYFSKGTGKSIETISPNDQHRIGQRRGMSNQDIWQLNEMYCEVIVTQPPPTTAQPQLTNYCIRHSGGLFVTASPGQRYLVLTTVCVDHFQHYNNNSLLLAESRLCLEPSREGNGALVLLSKTCDSSSRFQRTVKGSLIHLASKRCFHPEGGSPTPKNNTALVMYSGCNQDRLRFDFIKVK